MRDDLDPSGRRTWLVRAGRLAALGAAAVPVIASAEPTQSADEAMGEAEEVTARKTVDALQGAYGTHRGERRNHTKGVGAIGAFVGNPEVAAYSRSALFSGEEIDVVARFSIAGGDPDASDAERSTRGMALEFRLPDGALHHMTMLDTPMFFAAEPKTFLDRFVALAVDPATGRADPAKARAFEASHPDSAAQFAFLRANNPPPSYANSAYYGIHAFRFLDRRGKATPVRFRFLPWDGEQQLSDAEIETRPRDFLEAALTERLGRGPIGWDMVLTIGEPGDPTDDPTVLWPAGRREVKAGTLAIIAAAPSRGGAGSERINFDPMVMADGIEASDDPVLLFRSPSYAVSHTRRLRGL
jgi:catalase